MSIDSIKNFTASLSDISYNVIVQANSPLSEKAHPDTIKARTKALFHELSSSTLEPFEKSKLYSNLATGLKEYMLWMDSNEPALRDIVDSYGIIAPKIRIKAAKIMEQAKKQLLLHKEKLPTSTLPQHKQTPPPVPESVNKKQNQREIPDQFKKEFSPKPVRFGLNMPDFNMSGFNMPGLESFGSSDLFKQFKSFDHTDTLKSVVYELQQDQDLSRTLNDWHKQKAGNQPLTSFLQKQLSGGTCYGQVMTYIAQVKIQNGGKQNIQTLHNNAHERDFIRYQILHQLYVFSHNRTHEALRGILAQSSTSTVSKIASMLPIVHPIDRPSEKIASHNKKLLTNKLDKLLPTDTSKNMAIYCEFSSDKGKPGHASLIYYNPKDNVYFFYDSYSELTSGLFAANKKKALINGAVEKLIECAQKAKQTSISLYRYSF